MTKKDDKLIKEWQRYIESYGKDSDTYRILLCKTPNIFAFIKKARQAERHDKQELIDELIGGVFENFDFVNKAKILGLLRNEMKFDEKCWNELPDGIILDEVKRIEHQKARQAERDYVKKLLWDIIGIKKKNGSYEFTIIDEQMACFLQDYGLNKEARE